MDFPPIYNFPPFFTRQKHAETWIKQQETWITLILDYCTINKIFQVEQIKPIFENDKISRKLDASAQHIIVDKMIAEKKAVTLDNGIICILWKSINEWADYAYSWSIEKALHNTIITLYQLKEETLFSNMPDLLVIKILTTLQKRGILDLFKGSGDELGLKFK